MLFPINGVQVLLRQLKSPTIHQQQLILGMLLGNMLAQTG